MKTHEAIAIASEERSWKCAWCSTFIDDKPKPEQREGMCSYCSDYLDDCDNGLFDEPFDFPPHEEAETEV